MQGDPIIHNLYADGTDLSAVNREFRANARHCPPRKNGVMLYHEILSIAKDNRYSVTPEILTDLAQKYIALRACEALVFGTIHFDEKNPHVHLMISGNLAHRPEKLRLSKLEFDQVKRDLETYQKEKYPFLTHSLVFEQGRGRGEQKEKPSKTRETPKNFSESERTRRLHQQGRAEPSQKDRLRDHIRSSLVGAFSLSDLSERLREHHISLYFRGNRLAGVVFQEKKYRFRTLGIDTLLEEAMKRWERIPQRQESLVNIILEKSRQRAPERDI